MRKSQSLERIFVTGRVRVFNRKGKEVMNEKVTKLRKDLCDREG